MELNFAPQQLKPRISARLRYRSEYKHDKLGNKNESERQNQKCEVKDLDHPIVQFNIILRRRRVMLS